MLCFVAEKKAILNLRLKPQLRDEFAIAADLRGASMSGLLHQFIVRTIREEKEHSPQSFKKAEPTVNVENRRKRSPVARPVGKTTKVPVIGKVS